MPCAPRRRARNPRPNVDAPRGIAIMAPLANPPYPLGGGHRMRNLRIRHVLSALALFAQVAVEKMKGNLEKMGYKVEFVPFDDQAKPDVGVANAKNIIADKDIMAVI